ncbi:hypothetical protein C8R47DRAFT_1080342 [Mycena vitilis]|nr:hypothetical protein C8R47DRAFT_1083356 [Mycena vitilis]KAJ6462303.1 hypothetical protein C8R47DRAFT_1080342 [Mycena vitilis]
MAACCAYVIVMAVLVVYFGPCCAPAKIYICLSAVYGILIALNRGSCVSVSDVERADVIVGGGRRVFSSEFIAKWLKCDNDNVDWRSRTFSYEIQCLDSDLPDVASNGTRRRDRVEKSDALRQKEEDELAEEAFQLKAKRMKFKGDDFSSASALVP